MILTGPAIISAVKNRDIVIEPFHPANVNPNSYNYHLSNSLIVLGRGGRVLRTVAMSARGYVLKPGKVYLAATRERIGSDKYVILLLGRSSIGRLGIFLNVTADLGHVGSRSHWTLELSVIQPVRVYPGMKIGQVSFWLTDYLNSDRYVGRYRHDVRAVANRDQSLIRKTR
jgi:dCTP deaminase